MYNVLTKNVQQCDIYLLEATTEANIVILRFTDERNDVHVWKAVLYEIAPEFEIEASRPCTLKSKTQSELSCILLGNIPIPCLLG
jgi:hypothetical protein